MSPTYAVSLVMKNSSVRLDLMFRGFKNADECYKKVTGELLSLDLLDLLDDFDSRTRVRPADISAVIFNDIEKERKNQLHLRVEGEKLYAKEVMAAQSRTKGIVTMPPANQMQV